MEKNKTLSQNTLKQLEKDPETVLLDLKSSKSHGMAIELLPLFKCLQVLGRFPLLFEITEESGIRKVHYRFKFSRDPKFLFSVFVGVFVTFCCILRTFHTFASTNIFGDLWPITQKSLIEMEEWKRVKPMTRLLMNSFKTQVGLVAVLEFIIVWYTSPMLQKWLNDWNEIDTDFKTHFGTLYKPDLLKTQLRVALPYVIIPTIVFGGGLLRIYLNFSYPFGALIVFGGCFIPPACVQAEDAKVALMFKAIEASFEQIRERVQIRYQERLILGNKTIAVSEIEEIQGWHMILIKIRKQAELAGNYLAIQQLIFIASFVFSVSSACFVISNKLGPWEENHTFSMPLTLVFTIVTFARLFFKVLMAVRITEEEGRLAYLLKDLEFIETDIKCKQEVKEIHDMLVQRPTEISLNKYVTLNNSLILSIFQQILTQFIVFMQFQNLF